jgi:hypothetical protein
MRPLPGRLSMRLMRSTVVSNQNDSPAIGRVCAELLQSRPRVINLGLAVFATDLDAQDVDVVHVDWRPPAGGDEDLARLLSMLAD